MSTSGTYFPSFGRIICPPLWGTRIFPLCAKQEKLHFEVATDGPLDRFDGEPDESYLEDVKKFMKKTFRGWDCNPDRASFLQPTSRYLADDYKNKFPFSIQRLTESCFSRKPIPAKNRSRSHIGAVEQSNTQVTTRPNALGTAVVAGAKAKQRSDPRRTTEELQMAKVGSDL